MKINNLKTHMGWTIGVLSALFVGSISVSWANVSGLPDILSMALGMSSLFLAIVAIFQSIIGGGALSSTLGKIERAAEINIGASEEIRNAAGTFHSKSAQIDLINPSIAELRTSISALGSQQSREQNPFKELSEKSNGGTTNTFDQDDIYNKATLGFNISIYIAYKSNMTAKAFATSEILPDLITMEGALEGYLVSLRAAGVLEMDYVDGRMVVSNMGPFTEETILERMDESTSVDVFSDLKERIDKFFEQD